MDNKISATEARNVAVKYRGLDAIYRAIRQKAEAGEFELRLYESDWQSIMALEPPVKVFWRIFEYDAFDLEELKMLSYRVELVEHTLADNAATEFHKISW